jgi:hypothetical protein
MKLFYLLILSAVVLMGSTFPCRAAEVNTPDFLLIVNDSNPYAVTFTAATSDPLNPDSNHVFYDGIDLAGFFTTAVASLPTNLTPTVTGTGLTNDIDAAPVYDSSYIDHVSGTEVDFNLYTRTMAALTDAEDFAVDAQAFTGAATVDLSDYASLLPGFGSTGELFAGYSGQNDPNMENPLVFIGDYEVIPEPSQWSLLLLGAVGLVFFRRFRVARLG